MTVRIDITDEDAKTVVQVAGLLQEEEVAELLRACDGVHGSITLDLAGLVSADAGGIRLLQALRTAGAEVRGLTPYLKLLLKDEG